MKRAFLITVTLLLFSPPAFSQNAPDRDSFYHRGDRDMDDVWRSVGEGRGGGRRGGASFFLRNGDQVVAVRCDPQDSMKACVEATLALLERAKSAQSGGGAQGGAPAGQSQSR